MKKFAPKVFTIDVPDAIYLWPNYLKNFDKLIKFNITNEDKKKHFSTLLELSLLEKKDVSKDKKII